MTQKMWFGFTALITLTCLNTSPTQLKSKTQFLYLMYPRFQGNRIELIRNLEILLTEKNTGFGYRMFPPFYFVNAYLPIVFATCRADCLSVKMTENSNVLTPFTYTFIVKLCPLTLCSQNSLILTYGRSWDTVANRQGTPPSYEIIYEVRNLSSIP